MYECKICGKSFELKGENLVVIPNTSMLNGLFNVGSSEYEAFYCPHCGCQNIVNERKVPGLKLCENLVEENENG